MKMDSPKNYFSEALHRWPAHQRLITNTLNYSEIHFSEESALGRVIRVENALRKLCIRLRNYSLRCWRPCLESRDYLGLPFALMYPLDKDDRRLAYFLLCCLVD